MKLKSYIGAALILSLLLTATLAYGATSSGPAEPEEALKVNLYSAQYEGYLPNDWFATAKLNSGLTRTQAAYLGIYTLSKATGNDVSWLAYKTDLKDTDDPMLSRAVDQGLMSVGTDLKFNGSKLVSQQEMAVMTTKLLVKLGAYQKPTKAMTFKDKAKIAPWASESVQYLAEKKWLNWASSGNFEPTKTITLGRAIALSDQLLSTFKVYPAGKADTTGTSGAKTVLFDVLGFKVPLPTESELDISVSADNRLQIQFDGILKNRSANTYKSVTQQLITILDSKSQVGYDARSALLAALGKSWDKGTQTYDFKSDLYIQLDSGKTSTAKPGAAAILLRQGNQISLEIIL